jgi:hypothetical protein
MMGSAVVVAVAALAWRHWVAQWWWRLWLKRSGNSGSSAEVVASLAAPQWQRQCGDCGGSAAGGDGGSAVAAVAQLRR